MRSRPSIPGFSLEEAKELLGMCVVANYLGPVVFPPFPPGLQATSNPENPLPNDDGKTYPYPHERIWPEGWTPAVAAEDDSKPWEKSILTSRLSNGTEVNAAIVAYNSARDAYAVAFAGTLNTGAAMENIAALLIPAGPVNLGYFNSQETYVSKFPDSPVWPAGGQISDPLPEPEVQIPRVHLGYRVVVETLAVDPSMPANLKSILQGLSGGEIDLYVTGHSLGAAAAQLFSAWVKAGGVPSKKINVKCYSFATPRSVNLPMASNYDLALSNGGYSYRVDNSLDTAPQLPPTREVSTDLINPGIASDLQTKATPTGPYAASPLAPIVEAILASLATGGASAQPVQSAQPEASAPAPLLPLPLPFLFPFSLIWAFVATVTGDRNSPAASSVQQPPSGTNQPPSEAAPMNFVGIGTPYILSALPPVVYNGKCYPPEFFPRRQPDDLVEIPDLTTRQWWQHWPFNYAKYMSVPDK